MNKDVVYSNICDLVNNGYLLKKYIELTKEIDLDKFSDKKEVTGFLEEVVAKIFNAIVIGCQLFDDKDLIIKFVNSFSKYVDSNFMSTFFKFYNISEDEMLERLKHGFALHFTTPKISEEILKSGKIVAAGNNAMFTKEEEEIISHASSEQKRKNPDAETTMRYLFRGWGTGVSSYSSMTNGFWMYHTPESLSFLFGDISMRDKESSMNYVLECISHLDEDEKKKVFDTMSSIWDRLVGDEQSTCCILIDRDAFEYEVDYYYHTGEPVAVERRPYRESFDDINIADSKITNDIDVSQLRFIKIPTIIQLEKLKKETMQRDRHI